MKQTSLNYEEVKRYLQSYSSDSGPYDFNGLLHRILAAVDNMEESATDQDFDDFASSISEKQAIFLRKLLNGEQRNSGEV